MMAHLLTSREVCDALRLNRHTLRALQRDTPPDYPRPWGNTSKASGKQARYRWTSDAAVLLQRLQAVEASRSGQWPALTGADRSSDYAGEIRTDPSDSTPSQAENQLTDFSVQRKRQKTRGAAGVR